MAEKPRILSFSSGTFCWENRKKFATKLFSNSKISSVPKLNTQERFLNSYHQLHKAFFFWELHGLGVRCLSQYISVVGSDSTKVSRVFFLVHPPAINCPGSGNEHPCALLHTLKIFWQLEVIKRVGQVAAVQAKL